MLQHFIPLYRYLYFPNEVFYKKPTYFIIAHGFFFFPVNGSICQLNKMRFFAQLDTLLLSAVVLLTLVKVSMQGETGNLQIPLPLLN